MIEPVLDVLRKDWSNDVTMNIQEQRVPYRPQRKHPQRIQRNHESRHSRSMQYGPHISRRSNKAAAMDRDATRRRGDKHATTAMQHESHSSRRRVKRNHKQKRGGSLKQRLIGIIKTVFTFFKR